MRKPFMVGNLKMHLTVEESVSLATAIRSRLKDHDKVDCGVCPDFLAWTAVKAALQGSAIRVGAQNVHDEKQGAFTGEVSAPMLQSAGCNMVIVGHSERRNLF